MDDAVHTAMDRLWRPWEMRTPANVVRLPHHHWRISRWLGLSGAPESLFIRIIRVAVRGGYLIDYQVNNPDFSS